MTEEQQNALRQCYLEERKLVLSLRRDVQILRRMVYNLELKQKVMPDDRTYTFEKGHWVHNNM